MGNWSAPHAKFLEPIRGKGFRRLLQKNGTSVLLVDKYLTSQVCPECHERTLEIIHQHRNPRPWRRATRPQVTVHGLLRCTNRFNQGNGNAARREYRYWNRDAAAILDMIRIVIQARINGQGPPDLERPRQGPQVPA